MNGNFKNASVRVNTTLYQDIAAYAKHHDMTVSDVFRTAVENLITNIEHDRTNIEREEMITLREELSTKNKQISELHQLLGMAQKNAGELTQQLDRANLQLEDMRSHRSVWQRVKAVFAPDTA